MKYWIKVRNICSMYIYIYVYIYIYIKGVFLENWFLFHHCGIVKNF